MTFEEALVEHCSPTLAGVKTGNMFRYMVNSKTEDEAMKSIDYWSNILNPYGVKMTVLKKCRKSKAYLVYVYREKELESILADENVGKFMEDNSYCRCEGCECYLERLTEKLTTQDGFPHEVGIFLGYPLCDVKGFIEHKGKNYTCSGPWKSYREPGAAMKDFARLEKCKTIYKRLFDGGRDLVKLTVAAH